jgi:AraC-like DNA-binding protein
MDESKARPPAVVALSGCRIERVLQGAVEIVDAAPANRAFPDRVSESLGLCLKTGPAHEVRADGRALRYPADALCVRAPGTVWSARATGPAGFLSIDIERALLPEGGLVGPMRFVEPAALPGVRHALAVLRAGVETLDQQVVIAELIDAVIDVGLAAAPHLDAAVPRAGVRRARDLLESRVADPPTLQELADGVGANRFVLLRAFRRTFGVPPHAFLRRLRVERARALLARGADLSWTSLELGFADQSHFTRAFKEVVGIPPGAYRRAMRGGAARSIACKTRGSGVD